MSASGNKRIFPSNWDRGCLGPKPSHVEQSSSNPRSHQKTMYLEVSRLVGPSLLLRQKKSGPKWGRFYLVGRPALNSGTVGRRFFIAVGQADLGSFPLLIPSIRLHISLRIHPVNLFGR